MTSSIQLKRCKTLQAAAWLVMVGFVVQMGSVSCGCFEHNGWVLLFLDNDHHQFDASVTENDSDRVGQSYQHSHADDHVHNDSSDQQSLAAVFRPLHQCEPSAVVEGVLTEQIELPQTFAVAQPHHCKVTGKLVGSLSAHLMNTDHQRRFRQWPFNEAPARLLTQSFLI